MSGLADARVEKRPPDEPVVDEATFHAVYAEAVDILRHGHAHAGREKGRTPGGVPARNVAQPVIRSAYYVYCIGD